MFSCRRKLLESSESRTDGMYGDLYVKSLLFKAGMKIKHNDSVPE